MSRTPPDTEAWHRMPGRAAVHDNSAHFGVSNFDATAVGHRYAVVTTSRMGKLGDDALTLCTARVLQMADPAAQIRIVAPPSGRAALDDIDRVVIGGGLLYDRVLENLEDYLRDLVWARERGQSSACVGVGAQGIRTAEGSRLYREVLGLCRVVSARSERDRAVLADEVGVRCPVYARQGSSAFCCWTSGPRR